MKVIQINSDCGRGSTGNIAVAISKLLSFHDIDNYIFYSANHKSDYPLGKMIGTKVMLRFHQIQSLLFGDAGFHSFFSTKKLIKQIKQINPDIILLHNLHGYYLHLGVLFKFLKKYNKPIIWTLHDCWAFTGHCAHYTMIGCNKWKIGCGKCPQKNVYPYSLLFDRSQHLFMRKQKILTSIKYLTIVTPSEWLSKELSYSFLSKYPRCVIHNGINLNIFKPVNTDFKEKHGINNKIMLLGMASVWSKAKGLEYFKQLNSVLSRDQYQIVLVGTDKKIDSQLPNGILSIHRTKDRKELAEIYSAADIFINPSLQDTYPTVNLEAQACGTPVITFNTGGCPETIINEYGEIVKNKNVKELVRAIEKLSLKKNLKPTQFTEAISGFDENECFKKYINLIISLHSRSGETE